MRHFSETLTIATEGRSTIEISDDVQRVVHQSGVGEGLCNVFIRHTSASLIICENADPVVRADLERFAARLAPDGDPIFRHVDEGDDDMPAHVRAVFTQSSLGIPVTRGRGALGTWQGIYLWEHRRHPHRREVIVSVVGESR